MKKLRSEDMDYFQMSIKGDLSEHNILELIEEAELEFLTENLEDPKILMLSPQAYNCLRDAMEIDLMDILPSYYGIKIGIDVSAEKSVRFM